MQSASIISSLLTSYQRLIETTTDDTPQMKSSNLSIRVRKKLYKGTVQ